MLSSYGYLFMEVKYDCAFIRCAISQVAAVLFLCIAINVEVQANPISNIKSFPNHLKNLNQNFYK